ncbi:Ger(x)C family spore germination protein [Paenibacillus filicis]|uniref:Ger(X)C family spore germination protein n=1 Tax=Paenibacillus gyeongsangnamensis TaxID=3388067 RepID=A0ABT4Q7E1_9BACL|nr:Ger(x)C family spore germination protein [Paenibacillus filicis]MCZ8512746.1 Ger(x)C family spore germination protein [Paenibacillus filicis]
MKMYVPTLFFCFLISGCAKEQIIDRIKIMDSIGYDMDGDTFRSSSSYAAYEKKTRLRLFTAESKTFKGVWIPFAAQSDAQVVVGQLRTFVISEKFARRSIQELASSLLRDPLVSNNATVLITKQKASEIVSDIARNPPFFLSDMVKQNMEDGNTPFTNTHQLLDQYYGEGQDVFLPVLNKNKNGLLQMDGVGVFKGDKLRLMLTDKEAFFLKLLKDKPGTMTGYYDFITEQKEKIAFKILQGKRNLSPKQHDKVVISLMLHIEPREIPKTKSIIDKSDFLDLKKQIEQHVSNEINVLLKTFQMNNVDPVGFGELFRSRERTWNEQEFSKKTYANLKFEVKTEITITQSGVGIGAEQH